MAAKAAKASALALALLVLLPSARTAPGEAALELLRAYPAALCLVAVS